MCILIIYNITLYFVTAVRLIPDVCQAHAINLLYIKDMYTEFYRATFILKEGFMFQLEKLRVQLEILKQAVSFGVFSLARGDSQVKHTVFVKLPSSVGEP